MSSSPNQQDPIALVTAAHDHGHGHPHAEQEHDHPLAEQEHGHDHPLAEQEHGHDHPLAEQEHGHDHGHGPLAALQHMFTPHSHDSADKVDTVLESSSKGVHAVKVSLAALGVTAVVQLGIVLMTGSMALLADTIHNFSDALTAIPLWIAFVLGRRAATRRYTFGYRRAEDLAGLFIVAMIAFSAALAA